MINFNYIYYFTNMNSEKEDGRDYSSNQGIPPEGLFIKAATLTLVPAQYTVIKGHFKLSICESYCAHWI